MNISLQEKDKSICLCKDRCNILTITTGYHPQMVKVRNRRGVEMINPKQVIGYNENMSGIGRCDQMFYYSSSRKTIKCYKKVMFYLLDISI